MKTKKEKKIALRELAKNIGFDVNDLSNINMTNLELFEKRLSVIDKALTFHKKLKTTKWEKIKRRIKFEIGYYKKNHLKENKNE